ncbi:hypothetical protein [Rhodococcus sp. WAY2]|uniref:hypothetical protein n=1 Tax=Rhodococcus sp. WAY2 TaxID=2663121 RepID=UPI001356C1FD|nr:hypothetical protein [Rhodococcus sp. WAY2]
MQFGDAAVRSTRAHLVLVALLVLTLVRLSLWGRDVPGFDAQDRADVPLASGTGGALLEAFAEPMTASVGWWR